MDYSLKFTDEAQAMSVLFDTEPSTKPVLVNNLNLETVLDALPLADAQADQTVVHNGKTYMADAGKWYELVAYDKPVQARYANTDIIGTIYRNVGTEEEPLMEATPGFHVNVRTDVDAPELEPYQVFPITPVRVWA